MDYRRLYIPGGTYFFTVVTYQRKPIFLDSKAVDLLRNAFKYTMIHKPFLIVASVVMPDHLHLIWTLPENDPDFSTRWRLIKTYFTRHWRGRSSREPVWQPRYWEHLIRDNVDLGHHIEYIHYNPVKHRLTNSISDWPYSSFSKFVQEGFYPREWGKNEEVWAGEEWME